MESRSPHARVSDRGMVAAAARFQEAVRYHQAEFGSPCLSGANGVNTLSDSSAACSRSSSVPCSPRGSPTQARPSPQTLPSPLFWTPREQPIGDTSAPLEVEAVEGSRPRPSTTLLRRATLAPIRMAVRHGSGAGGAAPPGGWPLLERLKIGEKRMANVDLVGPAIEGRPCLGWEARISDSRSKHRSGRGTASLVPHA